MAKRKLCLLIFLILIFIIFIFFDFFFYNLVLKTVLHEYESDGHKITVYILDPGATASETINVSFDYNKFSKKRGNIYCARINEVPQINVLVKKNKIIIFANTEISDVFTKKNKIKDFEIYYEPY